MKLVAALILGAALGYFGIPGVAQSGDTYKTRLDLAGVGSVTATLSGAKLTVNGTFEGLKTNAVSAKLHNGIVAGVRGPAFADLTITKGTSGTISGSADLTPQQIQNLKKGGIYVQIYTEKPADGTLWGWRSEE